MKEKKMINNFLFGTLLTIYSSLSIHSQDYPIVDTGQETFYNNSFVIPAPDSGEAFFGQDAQYIGNQPSYTDNGDGTITDNVTDLMWQRSFITLD